MVMQGNSLVLSCILVFASSKAVRIINESKADDFEMYALNHVSAGILLI